MGTIKREETILHPVRLRIITKLSGSALTAGQLIGKLPDIPQATLYRHLKKLETSGVIEITETRQVRGAMEKTYSITDPEKLTFSRNDITEFTPSMHRKYFSAFLASIYSSFSNYIDSSEKDPDKLNFLGYHTYALRMKQSQIEDFQADFMALLDKYSHKEPDIKTKTFNLSTIFMEDTENEF